MLQAIFNCVKKRIKEECDWVKGVSIYQQQDIFQDESLGYNTPHVFVDFQDIEYETWSKRTQKGNITLVLKLVVEEYTKDYLKVLTKKDLLNKAINFWSDWGTPLTRITEQTDSNADSLYVFDISYETSFITSDYIEGLIQLGGTEEKVGILENGNSNEWGMIIKTKFGDTEGATIIYETPSFLIDENGNYIITSDGDKISIK